MQSSQYRHDGNITWLKPDLVPNSTTTILKPNQPTLGLTNINMTEYKSFGFTFCFYLTDFNYDNLRTASVGPYLTHIFSVILRNTTSGNPEVIRLQNLLFSHQYELKFSTSAITPPSGGVPTCSPPEPRYSWSDANRFKYQDIVYNKSSNINLFRNFRNDVWFVAFTCGGNATADTNFNKNETYSTNGLQLFYSRTNSDFKRLNRSVVYNPTFSTPTSWSNDNLNVLFNSAESCFILGSTAQGFSNLNTVPLNSDSWVNRYIENDINTFEEIKCSLSEIMLFNRVLSNVDLERLSALSPDQVRTYFSS